MDSENDRIRKIRQELNLTLEKFGQRLGVTKVAISNIEKGHRNVTDQMRKSICREYSVNEVWLKTGNGKMFLADEVKHLESFEKYLNSLGFSVKEDVTEWHYENPDELDPAEKVRVPDRIEYRLSKDGQSAVFTSEEYDDLEKSAKETIEGKFYKKIVQHG